MAVAVASTSSTGATYIGGSDTSYVITAPTGITEGDLLVIVAGDGSSSKPTATGFTEAVAQTDGTLGSARSIVLLYKIAVEADESAVNYTISNPGGGGGDAMGAVMLRITGWTSSNPIYASTRTGTSVDDSFNANTNLARPTASIAIMGIAGVGDASAYSAYQITSGGANPSWTERIDQTDSGGDQPSFAVAYSTTTETSNITNWGFDVGGADTPNASMFLAIIASPQNQTGTHSLLSASPAIFAPTAQAGTTGTVALLENSNETIFAPTATVTEDPWTNQSKESATWTPDNKNSATWSNLAKSSATWSDQAKS